MSGLINYKFASDYKHEGGALTPLTNVSPANPLLTEHTVFRPNPTTARPIKLENSKIAIAECSKTFTDRLELIHHFCDHFPAIFYSFEELKLGEKNDTKDKNNKSRLSAEKLQKTGKRKQKVQFCHRYNGPGVVSTPEPSTNNVDPTEVYALMQQLTSYNNLFDSNSSLNSTFQAATTSSSPMMSLASHLISKKKKKSSSHKLDKSHSNSTSASSFTGEQTKPITCISNDYSEQSKGGVTPHRPMNTSTNQCGSSNSQDLPYHMCPHCCLTFAELQPFQDHLQTHLTINTMAESGSGFGSPFGFNDPSHQPKLIKCRFCDMRFGNTYRLAEHEKLHAQNCCRCKKIFMTVFDLNLHMGTHTGYTYDCKDCGKCFPCRKTLAEHNRSHRILLSTSSDDNSLSTPQVPTTSAGIKSFSVATSLSNYSTISENPTPLFCLDFSAENSKKESSKKTREVSFPTVANPTMEDLNNRRPESLFNSNPYFTELLSQNASNGEKSRKQTTLVAVELNPHELIGSDGIPMATAITTNIQELQVKKENEYHTETSKKIEKN
uniref:C2H2-type domain-containing protein n=1 Tax=Ditylenchus dipsaci TaxID=166011 RepID=A0A915DLQ1_9BILA